MRISYSSNISKSQEILEKYFRYRLILLTQLSFRVELSIPKIIDKAFLQA